MSEPLRARVLVVAGMHRSGTSLLTKSLELHGVNLGSHLHRARYDNPKGFWEDIDIVRINDALLTSCRASWNSFVFDSSRTFQDDKFQELRDRACQLVRGRIAEFGLWGFKDPRACRFLGFWQEVIAAAGCEPLFVLAVRNPLSVAASLAERDQMPLVKSAYLWAQHTLPLFRDTPRSKRVVVDYDVFLARPLEQIRRIAVHLGFPEPGQSNPTVAEFLTEFLSAELRHTVYTHADLLGSPHIPKDVAFLYGLALSAARDELSLESFGFQSRVNELGGALGDLAPALMLVEETEQRLKGLQTDFAAAKKDVAILQASEAALKQRTRDYEAERHRLLSELAGKDSQAAELLAALTAVRG